MKIKKLLVLVLFTLSGLLYFSNDINAEEPDELILGGQFEDSEEYDEIMNLLSNDAIFPYVEQNFAIKNIHVTPDELYDIALKPYKTYFPLNKESMDLFDTGTTDRREYIQLLDQSFYKWHFLFKKDDIYVGVYISKIPPLIQESKDRMTQEEIEEYEKDIGKWNIGTSYVSWGNEDYRKIIEEVIQEKEDIKDYIIVGANYAGFGMVALAFDETKVKYIIPLYDREGQNEPAAFREIVPKNKAIPLSNGRVIYDYEEVAPYGAMVWENTKQYEEEHGFTVGGLPGFNELKKKLEAERTTKKVMIIVGIAALIVLIITGGVVAHQRKKRKSRVFSNNQNI